MSLFDRLAARPQAFDFYQVLRRLDASHRELPRIGDAVRPADEAVRLAQEPAMTFAPANLSAFEQRPHGAPRLVSRFLGLFGPQGALPTHLTELARERMRSYGDPTLARFADVFHHRLLCMFYKAWRQAQPTASHDRPDQDRFADYLDSLFGGIAGRDALAPHAARYFTGHLGRAPANACGLEAILSDDLEAPVSLQAFHPSWMPLPPDQRSSLRCAGNNQLGRNLVVGSRIRDVQHHFLLRLGPLSLPQYRSLLPGTASCLRLRDWVRLYTGRQFGWRAQLVLAPGQVPPLALGRGAQLGWTTWAGMPRHGDAVPGCVLDPESAPSRLPATAAVPSEPNLHQQEESCLK